MFPRIYAYDSIDSYTTNRKQLHKNKFCLDNE